MRCIYCQQSSDRSKNRAHVFPEAVAPEGLELPIGVECDKCNEYAGLKLESVLIRHPLIAMPLQLLELPGKGGKPRARLGIFERRVNPDMAVTFPIEPPTFFYGPDGVRHATFRPAVDPHLDYAKFSRALHHIAFNLFAHERGAEEALSEPFDRVRRYVRSPINGKERWTYVEVCPQMDTLVPGCGGRILDDTEWARLVHIRLLNVEYFVDLWNSGALLTTEVDGPVARAEIIHPEWTPPVPKPLEPGPDGKVRHYRVSIE